MKEVIRHYPVTTLLWAVIWIVCMIPVPETPLSGVSMIDKWTHLVMFGGLSVVIWWESRPWAEVKSEGQKVKNENVKVKSEKPDVQDSVPGGLFTFRFSFFTFFFVWLTGGLIELAQACLTNGVRSGEWLDFFADGIGAFLGQLIGILLVWCVAMRRKAV